MKRTSTTKVRVVAIAAAFGVAAAFASCHEHATGGGDADEYVVACKADMPAGTLFASDENFRKFVEAEAAGRIQPRDDRALTIDQPAQLSAATPPTFSFKAAMSAEGGAPPPAEKWCQRGGRRGWLARAAGEVTLIPRAEAHCPAFTGENYFLRLTNAANAADVAYTAVLSVTSYTPSAAIWSKAMSGRAGQMLKVTLWRATFLQGSISEGPFVASRPTTLVVAP